LAFTSREEIVASLQQHFDTGAAVACYRAPGRVNLMGEHTDYNQGLVLPMALEMACYVGVAPAGHGLLRVYTANLNETREWPVENIASAQPGHDWGDYVLGVAVELAKKGFEITACDMYLKSDVPEGAGLSSSASLEVGTAVALLASRPIEKLELAKLCQRVESQFVGVPCGIMDQYASVFGEPGSAIKIDCRTLESETVQLPDGIRVMVVNSLVKHELGTSAYRQRVAECQEAVAAIRKIVDGVTSLRDVSLVQLDEIQGSIPLTPRKRARHVVTDNARVLDFAAAARRSDLGEMGRLFIASHRSAQYDYEISCEEIDFLVDTAIKLDGVYGARMTGGGFGGCTVNLVAPDAIASFKSLLTEAYKTRYDKTPLFYECVPAAGAGPLP
jgi:galactokinase